VAHANSYRSVTAEISVWLQIIPVEFVIDEVAMDTGISRSTAYSVCQYNFASALRYLFIYHGLCVSLANDTTAK